MYNVVFRNSKAAMVFAAMTVVSAVVMIGSPEDEGVVNKAVDLIGQQRETAAAEPSNFAEPQSVTEAPRKSKPRWGDSPPTVFDDYNSESIPEPSDAAPVAQVGAPAKASPQVRIAGPQPVVADNPGTPVLGNDGD
jgi:hypothetical protein